jgi:hypothetical protein
MMKKRAALKIRAWLAAEGPLILALAALGLACAISARAVLAQPGGALRISANYDLPADGIAGGSARQSSSQVQAVTLLGQTFAGPAAGPAYRIDSGQAAVIGALSPPYSLYLPVIQFR